MTSTDPLDTPMAGSVIKWAPASLVERGIVAILTGTAASADTVDWGDGTTSTASGATLRHTFAEARAYTVTALQGTTAVARETVFVRDGLAAEVALAPASDNPNIVELTVNSEPADMVSRYSIQWTPDGQPELHYLPKGAVVSHGFAAGDHPVVVRDLHTGRALRETVTVTDPSFDPDFSIAKGADVMTAEITLSVVGTVKEILVDWGDGEQTKIPTPAVGAKHSHTYAANDTYIIQVLYSDASTDGAARVVTIPFAAMAEEPATP